jgi:spore coat polysaccharide biosynthesis protein SpsF
MVVDAVIQARLGSSRLPNKMVFSLHGYPIIEWVVRRVALSTRIRRIILATSTETENDVLEAEGRRLGIEVFRGSEDDVLGRFYHATIESDASHIIRICADNPLIWGPEIDNLIAFMQEHPCDYAYNHIPRNNRYPDGIGAEIVSAELLRKLHTVATLQEHREHIFSYIWDNPHMFTISTFDPPDPALHHPEIRLDVDSFEDFRHLALLNIDINDHPTDIIQGIKTIRQDED